MADKVIYEPHPVSPERKAELRAQGYRIIDARFKPADEPADPADTNADGKVTAAELKAALTEAGVKFHANLGKDKLAALWAAFQRWGGDAEGWNNLADEDKAARMAHVGTD